MTASTKPADLVSVPAAEVLALKRSMTELLKLAAAMHLGERTPLAHDALIGMVGNIARRIKRFPTC